MLRYTHLFSRLSKIFLILATCFSTFLGLLYLYAWHASYELILRMVPFSVPLHYWAAWIFILLGFGLALSIYKQYQASRLVGYLIFVLSFENILEYIFRGLLNIDFDLMQYFSAHGIPSSLMAPNTALCFMIFGVMFIWTKGLTNLHKSFLRVSIISSLLFTLGVFVMLGYLVGVRSVYRWGNVAPMAFMEAFGVMFLAGAIYAATWCTSRNQQRNVRLLGKAIIGFSITATLTIALILAALAALPLYQRLEEAPKTQLREVAQSKIEAIDSILNAATTTARQMRSRAAARRLLESFNAGEISLEKYVEQSKDILGEAFEQSKGLVSMLRLDQNGEIRVQLGEMIPPELWVSEVALEKDLTLEGPVLIDKKPYLVMLSPIYGSRSQRIGTDVLLFDLEPLKRILQFPVGIGEKGTIYLGRSLGDSLQLMSISKADLWTLSQGFPKDLIEVLAMDHALSGNHGMLEMSTGYFDVPVMAFYTPIQNSTWGLVIKVKHEQFAAWIHNQVFILFLILITLMIVGALIIYILVRPLTSGILLHTHDLEEEVNTKTIELRTELSKRKLAESELRQTNAFLRSVVENIPDMIFIKEAKDLKFVQLNRAGEELLGYKEKELLGKNDYDFFPKEQADFFTKKDREVLLGQKLFDIPEEPIHTRQKGERILHTQKIPILGPDNKPLYLLGISEDITERKRAENELQELNLAMANAVEGISRLDENGKFKQVNKAFADMLGYRVEELIGRPWEGTIHPQDFEKVRVTYEQMVRQGISDVTIRSMRKDGSLFDSELLMVRSANQNKIFTGYFCFAKDITEKKYRDALEIKSELISVVSHELRTPLHAMREGIQVILEGVTGDINQEQKEMLESAKRNADRLVRLVNSVLDFQKLESGIVEFQFKKGNINDLILEIKKTVMPLINSKNLSLEVELDKTLPDFYFDSDRMTQVLMNLINNAIKFTRVGTITLISQLESSCVKIAVKDTGIGIPETDVTKLFRKFGQLESGKVLSPSGAGLGLAISKKIIDRHQGRIWVESIPNKGSAFYVMLPLHQASMRISG